MLFHSVKNIKIVMYYLCKKCFRFYKYKHKVSFDTFINLYFYNSCAFSSVKELSQMLHISICKTPFLKCKQTLM